MAFASPVVAQTTWMPKFNSNQHVYLDPKLTQNPTYPVRLQGLDRQLEQAARQHNLEIYVVAAEQGQETLAPDSNWAVAKLDDLIARWQNQRGFPGDRHLTIFWVRHFNNVNQGWVAANAGSSLRAQGLTANKFSDPNGPVIPALEQYMPNNPQQAILAIVSNVNQEIDRYELKVKQQAEQLQRDRQHQQAMAALKQALLDNSLQGVLGAGVVGGILYLSVRFKQKRSQALALIGSWQDRLNHANELYLNLYDNYFSVLRLQNDEPTQYQSAVEDFTELTACLEAANQRMKAAQEAKRQGVFPFVIGFRKAIALLTKEPIVIIGQELPLEMVKPFDNSVAQTTYEPEQLLLAMAELFARVNSKVRR